MIYAVHVTVNTDRNETSHYVEASSLDTILHDVLHNYPNCTSLLMSIVPKVKQEFPIGKEYQGPG